MALVEWCTDATIRIVDIATGKMIRRLPNPGLTRPTAFSFDGKAITTVDLGGNVTAWEVATGAELRRIQLEDWHERKGRILPFARQPDDRHGLQ